LDQWLAENPSIDPGRIYVTGLSRGGFGTFDLCYRRPAMIAAAAPLCGGGDPEKAKNIAAIPLWIFHGEVDPVIPVQHSIDMYEALQKVGAQPRLTTYSTLGHAIWQETYYNPEVM
ncbi:prolyl oligopeptidase family serine peptidase, partial [Arthrospira platensis SPKY1]|nr:prolyl oligopeptidase family serine peptidase [Arthrospira platensis SPKY1]